MLLVLGTLLGLISGFAGNLHPAYDSVGAFRLHLAIGMCGLWLLALVLRDRVAKLFATLGLAAAAIGLTPTLVPQAAPETVDLRGFVQNLRFDNADLAAVEARIRALDVDFVLLQEVSRQNALMVEALSDRYPTRIQCEFAGVGGVAILTDLPVFGEPGCLSGLGLAWVEVQVPDGLVTLATLHLAWPWPYRQPAQIDRILPELKKLPGRVVLAGDFNMTPWGASVGRVAAASRTRVVPGLRLTFDREALWPGLPLDHVLVNKTITAQVQRLGKLGSDHNALAIDMQVH